MTDVATPQTSLLDAINISLSCLGETPVSATTNTSTNVVLAKQIIEEVSRDVQSKGWWFNTSGSDISISSTTSGSDAGGDVSFNSGIPEEARRYISIRAARVMQSRFVGSEELLKFSFQEEQVSLAILTQAHVRNAGTPTSFNSFPADLKGLGVEEFMFLQQSAEEKLLSLRLVTELKSTDKLVAEKELIEAQKSQVQTETVLKSQQALTELQNTNLVTQNVIKTAAEAGVVTTQQALIAQQVLDVVADTALKTKQGTKIDEEVDLLQTQDLLTDAQKATELQNAIKVAAEAGLVTSQQALVAQQVLDTVADTAIKGSQKLKIDEETLLVTEQKTLVTKQALTEVQNAIKVSADSGLVTAQQALVSQQALDAAADIALKSKQGTLVDAQASTEAQNTIKVAADAGLVTIQQALIAQQVLDVAADVALKSKQGSLVDAQVTTEGKRPADVQADTTLKGSQSSLVTAQALTEAQNAIKVAADAGLVTTQQALISQQVLDVAADIALKGKQGELVDAQATTEAQNAIKVAVDAGLVTTQQALVAQQVLESVANVSNITADVALKGKQGIKLDADTGLTTQQQALTAQQTLDVVADTELKGKQGSAIDADTALKTSQKTQLDAQTAIEATAEKAFYDGVVAGTQNTYRDFAAEMRMMGIQESQFQSTPAYKKIELLSDANKLRTVTATETGSDATELSEVNKVMRFIGEAPVSALNSNSLASECVRLLRDTNIELQGRGWWFNTDEEVTLTPNNSRIISLNLLTLSIEVQGHDARITERANQFGNIEKLLYNQADATVSWYNPVKAKVIYGHALGGTPLKYREYLNVRVALLLTELYPQSGIDIQRLPKMEAELRAYFKDREADDANYSVFDNYDTASRIGINRNYDLS